VVQIIITSVIVFLAAAYAARKLYLLITAPEKIGCSPEKCASCLYHEQENCLDKTIGGEDKKK